MYDEQNLSFYHGICTCMGKFGGALGATVFPDILQRFGIPSTMFLCSVLSIVASLVS